MKPQKSNLHNQVQTMQQMYFQMMVTKDYYHQPVKDCSLLQHHQTVITQKSRLRMAIKDYYRRKIKDHYHRQQHQTVITQQSRLRMAIKDYYHQRIKDYYHQR